MKKHKHEPHPHLRSYIGQARVQIHSAIRQLELAQAAFGPGVSSDRDHPLYVPAKAVEQLLGDLLPVREYVVYAHNEVIAAT
jgi:hypothetical protein